MFATVQATSASHGWMIAAGAMVVVLVAVLLASALMRRFFQNTRDSQQKKTLTAPPSTENASAFMAASMQAVIQQLRDQEKELERLHRLEKERAEQTEKLSEEVTRNMPAGLLLVNATGIISSANPAAEQALGARGLGFRRYSEVLGESSELTGLLTECLTTGKIFRREQVEHVSPGGEKHQLGVTISPIRRGSEKISGVICLLSDLTELAMLQRQVQLKENLAALGELSAGIAHEFKNALATISGYAQMIRGEAANEETSEYADKILEQTRNITHVVTEFLKYARPLEISSETVALGGVVERIVTEVGEANPQILIRFEGEFGEVAGDEGLLRQALLNLARNAAEACSNASSGGRVIVRGEIVSGDEVGFQRISVIDNGAGIAAEVLPKLFRPFFTTKAAGTGLGLAVVQKIIVQHGGQVEARNRQEGGAAFIVTLPVCRTVAEAVESKRNSI